MSSVFRRLAYVTGFFLAFSSLPAAHADAYPSHAITLLVPLAAGSTADIMARLVGTEMSKALKEPVIVMNKPGAGGNIALAELARAAPDGYTIAFASQGQLVFNQVIYKRPGFSQHDVTPLDLCASVANVLVVPANSPFRSVADLIRFAKAHPGEVNYSSGGSGTSHHLSSVLLGKMVGLNLIHVPYAGAPQGTLAVMSGEVQMGIYNISTELSGIRSGKLKALAVTGDSRSPLLPEVPTMQEAGVKGYQVTTWMGMVAPARTPADTVHRLHDAIAQAMDRPSVKQAMISQGLDRAASLSPDAFGHYMAQDLVKWTPIIKASGASVN
jgi:tripartite-type tricarboxylate transporter receptor subunit TctC